MLVFYEAVVAMVILVRLEKSFHIVVVREDYRMTFITACKMLLTRYAPLSGFGISWK